MDPAALARLIQYLAVAIVGGSSLALARVPAAHWPRGVMVGAALIGVTGVGAWLAAQAVAVADLSALPDVATGTGFGRAALARGLILLIAAGVALGPQPRWRLLAALGGVAAASFAWTGHGTVGGPAHLFADIVHVVAATIWLGALPVLGLLALDAREPRRAAEALRGFSAIGPTLVALILASGLANSWTLVGPDHVLDLTATTYGQLLAAKLALFLLMLGLAAANRWSLTPALDRAIAAGEPPPRALIASLWLETLAGAAVLALVAVMGTLPPPIHT